MTIVFKLADEVFAFKNKPSQWKRRVSMGILDMFSTLSGYLKETVSDTLLSQLIHEYFQLNSSVTSLQDAIQDAQRNGFTTHLRIYPTKFPCRRKKKIESLILRMTED